MPNEPGPLSVLRFQPDFRVAEAWRVQPALNRIEGPAGTIQLEPKVMQVLVRLAERPGTVVTRDELFETVWAGTVVTDAVLTRSISELRKALGDDPVQPRVIETIRKNGYRLIAPVQFEGSGDTDPVLAPWPPVPGSAPRVRRRWMPAACVALGMGLVGLVWAASTLRRAPAPEGPLRSVPATTFLRAEVDPALSPDGNQLAFAWPGPERGENWDIYVKTVGTEAVLRLTTHPGRDAHPTWSPDGRHVAFTRMTDSTCAVVVVPNLGGGEREMAPCSVGGYIELTWGPGGVLAVADQGPSDPASRITAYAVADRRIAFRVPQAAGDSDVEPVFSPDGRTLAFFRGRGTHIGLYTMDVADRAIRQVAAELPKPLGLGWLPDGRHLVYGTLGEQGTTLWRIPMRGGRATPLPLDTESLLDFSIARNVGRLAFEQPMGNEEAWALSLDAPPVGDEKGLPILPAVPVSITTHRESHARFSPDGRRIAFVSTRSGVHEVWTADADGGRPVSVARLAAWDPAWAPDGRWIVVVAPVGGHDQIQVLDVAGGTPRVVTQQESAKADPAWSNDGRWIYFVSGRGGGRNVWRIPAGGGPARPLTRHGRVAYFQLRADGSLYYSRLDTVGIWRQGTAGDPALVVADLAPPDAHNWTLAPGGLYHIARPPGGSPQLVWTDEATHATRAVARLLLIAPGSGLSLSPDGRRLLFTIARSYDDIGIVDGLW
ncbi:MAG TPA: winged helix-turn-helix domain-containing protein [Rhodothermales bacterium]|nr:winged helix-turn-helix domain-containing protein [Rhodothermales bacterium]